MKWFSKTDTGRKRPVNQDALFAAGHEIGSLPDLFLVADGMGGHNAGDYASGYVIRRMNEIIEGSQESDVRQLLTDAVQKAGSEVYALSKEDSEKSGMGTTLVGAVIEENSLLAMNIGDSRLYLMHDGTLRQITEDHSFVQEMVKSGEITPQEALHHPRKNVITRAVGVAAYVEPDFFIEPIEEGDQILLCSDGLINMVSEEEIAQVLSQDRTLEDKVETLIESANENGGLDNISVILVQP